MEVCAILIDGTLEREVTITLQTVDGTAFSEGMQTLNYLVCVVNSFGFITIVSFYLKRAH